MKPQTIELCWSGEQRRLLTVRSGEYSAATVGHVRVEALDPAGNLTRQEL